MSLNTDSEKRDHLMVDFDSLQPAPRTSRFVSFRASKLTKAAPRKRAYMITDFITNFEDVSKVDLNLENNDPSYLKKLLYAFHILNPSVWIVLILLGVISAILGFVVDVSCEMLQELRYYLSDTDNVGLSFTIWMIYGFVFAALAACCGKWISVEAEGSGIPEMRAILSGVDLGKYLTYKCLLAKIVGLILATAGGLSIGREGPFVHISGIVAHKLCKFRMFKALRANKAVYYQILGAGVAAGIAATFGSPMGGVLFSIEVTATYYLVSNLWKGIFSTVFCVIAYVLLHNTDLAKFIHLTDFSPIPLDWTVVLFALLGIICGLVGAFYSWFASKMYYLRKHQAVPWLHQRFRYTLLVTLICGVIGFVGFLKPNDKDVINAMFLDKPLTDKDAPGWEYPTLAISLLICAVTKTVLSAISISCPIPSGTFVPVFTAGAILGRFFGFIVDYYMGTNHAGLYALVGASALTCAVSHTLSVTVIVFELTGQIHYMVQMIVGTLFAYAVAFAICPSIYDYLLTMKGVPYLPNLKSKEIYKYKAKDVMNRFIPILQMKTTLFDLLEIVNGETKHKMTKIPITDDNKKLIGQISMREIKRYLERELPPDMAKDIVVETEPNQPALPALNTKKIETATALNPIQERPEDIDEVAAEPMNREVGIIEEGLKYDESPLSVTDETPLAKVHFLFTMLGLSQVYVTNRGDVLGAITKHSFSDPARH